MKTTISTLIGAIARHHGAIQNRIMMVRELVENLYHIPLPLAYSDYAQFPTPKEAKTQRSAPNPEQALARLRWWHTRGGRWDPLPSLSAEAERAVLDAMALADQAPTEHAARLRAAVAALRLATTTEGQGMKILAAQEALADAYEGLSSLRRVCAVLTRNAPGGIPHAPTRETGQENQPPMITEEQLNDTDKAIARAIRKEPGIIGRQIADRAHISHDNVKKRLAKGMPLNSIGFRAPTGRKGYLPPDTPIKKSDGQ